MTASTDFAIDHLTEEQAAIARAVLQTLPSGASGGGCRAFFTPDEWRDRGEKYGVESALVLVHDGGALAPYCNLDYMEYDKIEALGAAMNKLGYYVEQCTSWYSAVYKL